MEENRGWKAIAEMIHHFIKKLAKLYRFTHPKESWYALYKEAAEGKDRYTRV